MSNGDVQGGNGTAASALGQGWKALPGAAMGFEVAGDLNPERGRLRTPRRGKITIEEDIQEAVHWTRKASDRRQPGGPGMGSAGMKKAVSITGKITMYVPVEIGNPVFWIKSPILARGL